MIKSPNTFCALPYIAVDVLDGKFSPCCNIDKKIFSKWENKIIRLEYDASKRKNKKNIIKNTSNFSFLFKILNIILI